jgi:DNA-binding LacI/PurR family transcriptional regulator
VTQDRSEDRRVVIGVDFGTSSGRAVVVRVADGAELASAVHEYRHGVGDRSLPAPGAALPPDWALQVSADYLEVLKVAVPEALRDSGAQPRDVIGIDTDFIACTLLLALADGNPVAKGFQLLEEDRTVHHRMRHWVEAADWVVWQLCGTDVHNACAVEHTTVWREGHYPSADFLTTLRPEFGDFFTVKVEQPIDAIYAFAGRLTAQAAEWTGLPEGIAVCVGHVDTQVTPPLAAAAELGQMVAVMGTSTGHVLSSAALGEVPGMCSREPSLRRRRAMHDVARVAGVSHQTVSRVLNAHPSVRPGTRERVLAAIEELGYRPNSAARALVTGRSRLLGVVTVAGTLHGPVSMLYGVEAAAQEQGYSVTVAHLRADDPHALTATVTRLQRQGVDGVVVIAPLVSMSESLANVARQLPLVVVGIDLVAGLPIVSVDNEAGARIATEHLLALGHRSVWHLGGPPGWYESYERSTGWSAALTAAGIEVPPALSGDWSPRAGYQAGQMLARMPDVTAVFAANDQMALGLLRALREHRRPVPEEVSVVGFDDIPEAAYLTPPLTTIRQPFDALGRQGLQSLLSHVVSGRPADPRVVLEPQLVVRESSSPPVD